MNPPHILIARHSRGGPNSSSLSTPTETHAAAAGIFRSSTATGSPTWYHLEECDSADELSALSTDAGDYEDPIEIDETFTRAAKFPGTVQIIVESTTFWAHKEVLYFASSFFQAALSGEWAETSGGGRPQSMSSVITISQPRISIHTPGKAGSSSKQPFDAQAEMSFASFDADTGPEDIDTDLEGGDATGTSLSAGESDLSDWDDRKISENAVTGKEEDEYRETARTSSLNKLESKHGSEHKKANTRRASLDDKPNATLSAKPLNRRTTQFAGKRRAHEKADAVIVLKEEKVQ